MLSRLHILLFGDEATSASTSETLESFMYRLHSRPAKERNAAVKVTIYTRVKIEKIDNLFQVDINRREQGCAAHYEQYCQHVVTALFNCNKL